MTVCLSATVAAEDGRGSKTCNVSVQETLLWIVVAVAAFHMAYWSAIASYLIGMYLFALVQLSRAESWRKAFYAGLTVGLLIAVGRLEFFWRIFSGGAVALWLVYAFWIGLFTALARLCFRQLGRKWACVLLPFLWCGLEYFRSELYYLRFSWLTPALAFGLNPTHFPFGSLGTYGLGFVLMSLASGAAILWQTSRRGALLVLFVGMIGLRMWGWAEHPAQERQPTAKLRVAGVQLEFPTEKQVCTWLTELVRRYPGAELLVLSEYTFAEPIPDSVKTWCRDHKRYLIVGGKDPVSSASFYNTAFVISPEGKIVFRQVKAVPIQFFNDGLPAPEQVLWPSPWGKIGLCICYDLSYARVTDRLVRQGAEALIVPTMDVEDWGKREHALHARIAPVRAAEYRIPIFRLASSGISQVVDSTGHVVTSAPCPGDGAMIEATLKMGAPGRPPWDRWLAPFASMVTGILVVLGIVRSLWNPATHVSKRTPPARSVVDCGSPLPLFRRFSLGRLSGLGPVKAPEDWRSPRPGGQGTRPCSAAADI